MLACSDCRYCSNARFFPHCTHPQAAHEVNDYLTGGKKQIRYTVEIMRQLGECGPEGTLFEPRDEVGFV